MARGARLYVDAEALESTPTVESHAHHIMLGRCLADGEASQVGEVHGVGQIKETAGPQFIPDTDGSAGPPGNTPVKANNKRNGQPH